MIVINTQPNSVNHWVSGIAWFTQYPALALNRLESPQGKGTFVPLILLSPSLPSGDLRSPPAKSLLHCV